MDQAALALALAVPALVDPALVDQAVPVAPDQAVPVAPARVDQAVPVAPALVDPVVPRTVVQATFPKSASRRRPISARPSVRRCRVDQAARLVDLAVRVAPRVARRGPDRVAGRHVTRAPPPGGAFVWPVAFECLYL